LVTTARALELEEPKPTDTRGECEAGWGLPLRTSAVVTDMLQIACGGMSNVNFLCIIRQCILFKLLVHCVFKIIILYLTASTASTSHLQKIGEDELTSRKRARNLKKENYSIS
jgi:hypothetical protein